MTLQLILIWFDYDLSERLTDTVCKVLTFEILIEIPTKHYSCDQ